MPRVVLFWTEEERAVIFIYVFFFNFWRELIKLKVHNNAKVLYIYLFIWIIPYTFCRVLPQKSFLVRNLISCFLIEVSGEFFSFNLKSKYVLV